MYGAEIDGHKVVVYYMNRDPRDNTVGGWTMPGNPPHIASHVNPTIFRKIIDSVDSSGSRSECSYVSEASRALNPSFVFGGYGKISVEEWELQFGTDLLAALAEEDKRINKADGPPTHSGANAKDTSGTNATLRVNQTTGPTSQTNLALGDDMAPVYGDEMQMNAREGLAAKFDMLEVTKPAVDSTKAYNDARAEAQTAAEAVGRTYPDMVVAGSDSTEANVFNLEQGDKFTEDVGWEDVTTMISSEQKSDNDESEGHGKVEDSTQSIPIRRSSKNANDGGARAGIKSNASRLTEHNVNTNVDHQRRFADYRSHVLRTKLAAANDGLAEALNWRRFGELGTHDDVDTGCPDDCAHDKDQSMPPSSKPLEPLVFCPCCSDRLGIGRDASEDKLGAAFLPSPSIHSQFYIGLSLHAQHGTFLGPDS